MTLSAPFRVTWDLTRECNLSCRHCYNASSVNAEEPPSVRVIAEKLSIAPIFMVTLSGGEPLMEPEIWSIIQQFRKRGKSVQLISNGTLITERIARKIKDSNVNSVQISLDGLKETHNFQRGVDGCFEKSMSAIKHLVKEGIPVTVNTIVSQRNIEEIPLLIEVLLNLGVNEFRVSRMVLMGRGGDLEEEMLSKEQTRSLTLYVLEKRKALEGRILLVPDECMSFLGEKIHEYGLSWYGCPAGRTECAVDCAGNVYPCVFLTYEAFKMGNLTESDFDTIWHSSQFEDFREIERKCSCEIADFCKGGCPAAAYGKYGDMRQKDPYCWRNAHE